MRAVKGLGVMLMFFLGTAQALPNTLEMDELVSKSHVSCKSARDMRRKDPSQSKALFQYYLQNREALSLLEDEYVVKGLTAAKVKKFCKRIEKDLMRGEALTVYDQASRACRASTKALNDGKIKEAKSLYSQYEAYLSKASDLSEEAIALERGSLQWRQCEKLKGDLANFTSGKIKKLRDRLDSAYSRCLPIWSELSTQGSSTLTAEQLSAELRQMKSSLTSLQPEVTKLNARALESSLQEFKTCVNQVEAGIPKQYAKQRLSALNSTLQICQSVQLPAGFKEQAELVLQNQISTSINLSVDQITQVAAQEEALKNCIDSLPPELAPLPVDIEPPSEEGEELDVIDQMLQEESVLQEELGSLGDQPQV